MISENHYNSLRDHISSLISGILENQKDLPDEIIAQISESYYQEALETLEKQRNQLKRREEEYKEAIEKFRKDYELVRKKWKRDIVKLKRELGRNSEALRSMGVTHR